MKYNIVFKFPCHRSVRPDASGSRRKRRRHHRHDGSGTVRRLRGGAAGQIHPLGRRIHGWPYRRGLRRSELRRRAEAIAGPTVYDLGPSGKTGWLYGVFNPALAGYVLKDAEGNVLESGGAENLSDAEFYSFPVSGSYKYVLSITEKSEATPQADASTYNAIPEGGALVLALASKRKTPVGAWTASNRSVISTTPATAFALRPIHRWA